MKLKKTSFQHPAIYGLALLNILIHLAVYKNLEYHRDELLYFSLGLHPDFGYATVPPLIGWIASAMQMVFGFSLFAVKLFPAILGGLVVLITADITKILGGKTYAQILGALAILIMPVTLRAFYLFQPVAVDVFFWVFCTWLLLRYMETNTDRLLVALGASFGIAMLNKYLIALWILALLVPIAFSKYRMIFKKRAFYIALIAGFIIFLPNFIWQLAKGLPVINHMQQLHDHQLVHVSRLGFLTDQLLNPLAASVLTIPGFFYLWKNKKYRFLAYSVLIVILSL
ncbi:MAG: glycosyltransferase family 39 protein, partial [Flavobacteriaceae bacterium]|nr:glycosyltransferase family 39 protein [Flavobacteriaceae bacterium]